jgi:hypothetical protein
MVGVMKDLQVGFRIACRKGREQQDLPGTEERLGQ